MFKIRDVEDLYVRSAACVAQPVRVAVLAVLLSLGLLLLWASPAVWQVPHFQRAVIKFHGPSSSGWTSSAAATGATGTLFSGAKQRTYTGARIAGTQGAISATSSTNGEGRSSQPAGHSKQWAVVTTINPPTKAITDVAALPGWSVVVVGDVSSAPFNVSATNVVFLSAEAQKQLAAPYASFAGLLPWKHFGRKNLGFLDAILHGAESIWDFDDDNMLKPGHTPQLPTSGGQQVQLLGQGSCAAFNPYPRMGGPSASDPAVPPSWPRGFPLDLIRSPCPHRLVPTNLSRVAVLQSLADNDPDVDAIYRLTRGVPFSFRADSRQTLVLPQGSLTPWNAQVGC